jgi:Pectate lyase superfamily protein
MSRLPTIGSDNNAWGTVLNDFLSVAHNADGSLKNLFINVKDPVYGAKGDGSTDDTAAIQGAINALPSCSVIDVGGNTVTGKTGVIFFPPGVYAISSLLTIPAGSITLQGSGMSSWVPIMNLTPYENLGGTTIVTTDYTDGLMSAPKDSFSYPATALFLRDLDFRTVSPASAQTSSTPPIISLSGMISGEISNINALEVITAGGIGRNLFKIFSLEPGSAADYKYLHNIRAFGGTQAVILNATHLAAINVAGGYTGTGIAGVTQCAIFLIQNDDNYFSDLHCFSSPYGLASDFGNENNHPIIIHGSHFESCTHYLAAGLSPTHGTLILENPTWNSAVDPTTDIPAQIPSTIAVISKYEVDRTGLYTPTHVLHVAPAKFASTAGTSPFTFTVNQYDCVYVLTTVGGMTALTLDGQALFNGSFSVGQTIFVGAGHKLIATWATTAPVFEILPQ